MKITKIHLINFRNYSNVSLNFGSNMNILIGDNAKGKTNILESIVLLALTKSHRVSVHPNLIMFGKSKTKIQGVVEKNAIINKLEIEITPDIKKLKVNQTEIKRLADYISNLNIIAFTPDDLEIIKGSPNIRRNLLNIQLSQISKVYLNTYNQYNKILKTRNEYLKILLKNSIADQKYLDIITDKLIEKAIMIYQKREEYISFVNENIDNNYQYIIGESGLKIQYEPNILINSYDSEEIRRVLKETYKKNYYKELNCGMTLYGPHRDEFKFIFNGIDLKYFGSQGQQKIAVLSYKLSEIPIFTNICGTSPVLLLDDIFSELDIKKRNRLLKLINGDIQSIITTTDLKNIRKNYLKDAFVYEISNGKFLRK